MRGIVKDVQSQKLILDDGTEVPYGLLVWSTGVGPSSFVRSLSLPKDPTGRLVHQDHSIKPFFAKKNIQQQLDFLDVYLDRIGIDEWMRVPSVQDVFAIGDCSGYLETTGKPTLPALAQVDKLHTFFYLSSLLIPFFYVTDQLR